MLAESFVREDTLVAVVGTLSPAAADAEHSLATMRTICSLAGEDARVTETREEVRPIREEVRRQPPQKWGTDKVREWVGEVRGGELAGLLPLMPGGLDGKGLCKMSARQMATLWRAKDESCAALFAELRAEMKRVNEHEQAPRRPRPRPIPGVSPLP